jgi:hypothetical protein
MPIPACDTTPSPSADTFTRGATAIFFTCEVPFRWNDPNLRQVRLSLAGQALSRIYTPELTTFREKSGLNGEQGAMVCAAKIVEVVPDMDAKFGASPCSRWLTAGRADARASGTR